VIQIYKLTVIKIHKMKKTLLSLTILIALLLNAVGLGLTLSGTVEAQATPAGSASGGVPSSGTGATPTKTNCGPGGSGVGTPECVDAAGSDSSSDAALCGKSKTTLSVNLADQKEICYDKCKLSGASNDPGCSDISKNPIYVYMKNIINIMTVGVAIVVVLMIVIRGLQYSWARDNAQKTTEAKDGIVNAIVAILLYIFAYAILNFLIPGGLIG
jgi:hypothetical protein